jgi:hypothetical protein
MPHSVTITAKTGPNAQNTAMVYANVRSVVLDFTANTIAIDNIPPLVGGQPGPGSGDTIREYDMAGVTAIADTITAGQHAIVIS